MKSNNPNILLVLLLLLAVPVFAGNSFFGNLINNVKVIQTDSINELTELEKRAESFYYEGNYNGVINITDSVLPTTKPINSNDSITLANVHYHRFESYYRLGQLKASIVEANKGLVISPVFSNTLNLRAILYYKRAYAESDLGFSLKSRRSMLESVSLLESHDVPDLDYLIGAYLFLSSHEAYHGNLEQAQRYLRLAERTYRRDKKTVDEARKGPNGENDRYEVMFPYRNIYVLYSLGETKADSLAIENQLKKLKNLKDKPDFSPKYESIYYTQSLNHYASWLISKSETAKNQSAYLNKALSLINEAIFLTEKSGFVGRLSTLKFYKSKALLGLNKLNEAGILIDNLIVAFPEKSTLRPFFLAQKAQTEIKKGNKDEALNIFKTVISLLHQGTNQLKEDYSNFQPSTSYNATKLLTRIAEKLEEAYPEDKDVTRFISSLYIIALKQFQNSTISSNFSPNYDETLRLIIAGILKYKNETLAVSNIGVNQLLETTEILKNKLAWKRYNQNRFTNSLEDLDSLRGQGLELRNALVTAKEKDNLVEQDSLQGLISKNENSISQRYPNLDLMTSENFELTALQNSLDEDTIILKYIQLEGQLAIFRVTKTAITVNLLNRNEDYINKMNSFIDSIKAQHFDDLIAKELGQLLLRDITGYKTLIIIPDATLFKLPFELLRVNNQWAIEGYNIRYSSNLGFVEPNRLVPNGNDNLAIYVPDYDETFVASADRADLGKLVGAQKEAHAISQFFDAEVYDQKNLSKSVFFNTASRAKLLHLAMHSEVDNERPELSKLLFANGMQNNDELYLEEIYGLSLSAELVVLSACNTGVGKENAGRSLESFQRAFTFAGVPSAVASLWEVPDLATQDIMETFYKNLSNGETKSIALRNAKLDFKNKHAGTKLEQPFYWAGFVLYGSDVPIISNESSLKWYMIISICLLTIIWLVTKRKK